MGAHYRSVQVRSENRDEVLAALDSLARPSNARLLVGPTINGWTGIYLNESPSNETFVRNLGRQFATGLLDLMVHDSDVFSYQFYRGGQSVDEYCSRPDYFEEVSREEHQRLLGKPEVFRDLVGSVDQLARLEALLNARDDEAFVFEERRLQQFAELLGIANTLTSYAYLTQGEWDGIKGRNQFQHVPDLSEEKNAAKAQTAALRAEVKRLKKEGILCFESVPPLKTNLMLGATAFDPLSGGLFFKWNGRARTPEEPKLVHVRPPWTAEPEAVALPGSSASYSDFVLSRTGKWFAASDGRLRLVDWATRTLFATADTPASPVEFSADEQWLLCRNQHGFELFSIESKRIVRTISAHPHFLAWHPSGKFLVTRPRQDQLELIDLDSGRLPKVLYSGEIIDQSNLASLFSDKLRETGISEEQLVEMRQGFIRGSDEPFSLKFSPDGRLLFCATTRGLRVLEWDQVLAAERATPPPLFAVSPAPLESPLKPRERTDYIHYVYDVVFDEKPDRLLFSGIEGIVRFFNLADRSTGILFKPPSQDYIWRLQLSPDREHLCCYRIAPVENRGNRRHRIEIWNYRRLRTAAGLE